MCSFQITKINPRLASLDILCVGNRPLNATFSGIIRRVWGLKSKSATPQQACVADQAWETGKGPEHMLRCRIKCGAERHPNHIATTALIELRHAMLGPADPSPEESCSQQMLCTLCSEHVLCADVTYISFEPFICRITSHHMQLLLVEHVVTDASCGEKPRHSNVHP